MFHVLFQLYGCEHYEFGSNKCLSFITVFVVICGPSITPVLPPLPPAPSRAPTDLDIETVRDIGRSEKGETEMDVIHKER